MGNPIVRRIRNNTFGNGPVVRANDGALLAELQGNAAKKINIQSYTSYHDISAQVPWFALDALDVSTDAQKSNPSESGVVWLHRVPRKKTLSKVSMYFLNGSMIVGPGLKTEVRLMKSDKFPGEPSFNVDEMGEIISTFYFDTTPVATDTTMPEGWGTPGTTSHTVNCRAGDYLFLYSTFSMNEGLTKFTDFTKVVDAGKLSLHLVFKEEHA